MTSQSSLVFASHSHAFRAAYSFRSLFVLKLFSFRFPFFHSCRSLTLATDSISALKTVHVFGCDIFMLLHSPCMFLLFITMRPCECVCVCACIWCSSKTNRNSNRYKFRFIWHATTWSFRSKSLQSTIQCQSVCGKTDLTRFKFYNNLSLHRNAQSEVFYVQRDRIPPLNVVSG